VRRLLAVCCLIAASYPAAQAVAAPQPQARAWLVENASTGEVLASSGARDHLASLLRGLRRMKPKDFDQNFVFGSLKFQQHFVPETDELLQRFYDNRDRRFSRFVVVMKDSKEIFRLRSIFLSRHRLSKG